MTQAPSNMAKSAPEQARWTSLQANDTSLYGIADQRICNAYSGGIKYVSVCPKLRGIAAGIVLAQRIGDCVTTTRETLEVDHDASPFRIPDQIYRAYHLLSVVPHADRTLVPHSACRAILSLKPTVEPVGHGHDLLGMGYNNLHVMSAQNLLRSIHRTVSPLIADGKDIVKRST